MSKKKLNLKLNGKSGNSFRQEGDATFFSVADFLRVNGLPDDPQLRSVVVEEVLDMFPNVLIVEEWN